MNRSRWGLLIVLAVSLVLGVLAGWIFYRTFQANVPEAMLSQFSRATAPIQFIGYGLLLGLVIFLWTLLAASLARFFRGAGAAPVAGTPPRGHDS